MQLNRMFISKVARAAVSKTDSLAGHLRPIRPTLEAMAARPYELHLELTNLCNANCIFCPYQFQQRAHDFMGRDIFEKALGDFVAEGGGSVFLTPIVGDPLIHKEVISWVRDLRAQPKIDRIMMITNCILADRWGAEVILTSGLTTLIVSTAGFDEQMYRRVYRSTQYQRMRRNVLALLTANERLGKPINLVIGLRPDRALQEVMRDPDFQEVLAFNPQLDFTWAFSTSAGRLTRDQFPTPMRLRSVPVKREPCVETFNGPMVLPDGTVIACSCIAAIDATVDLRIGHILEESLGSIWRSEAARRLRASFGTGELNPTCKNCDMYHNLDLYRTAEGRKRASISRDRAAGRTIRREPETGAFPGG
jgi:radical SAM protein with 4Fe4S-binding SPASM domain